LIAKEHTWYNQNWVRVLGNINDVVSRRYGVALRVFKELYEQRSESGKYALFAMSSPVVFYDYGYSSDMHCSTGADLEGGGDENDIYCSLGGHADVAGVSPSVLERFSLKRRLSHGVFTSLVPLVRVDNPGVDVSVFAYHAAGAFLCNKYAGFLGYQAEVKCKEVEDSFEGFLRREVFSRVDAFDIRISLDDIGIIKYTSPDPFDQYSYLVDFCVGRAERYVSGEFYRADPSVLKRFVVSDEELYRRLESVGVSREETRYLRREGDREYVWECLEDTSVWFWGSG